MGQWLGWLASAVLLATLLGQVWEQWRSGTVQGVSPWLFRGQLAASTGFVLYSAWVENWVFLTTNLALLATALAGHFIYRRNARRSPSESFPATRSQHEPEENASLPGRSAGDVRSHR